MVGGCGISKVHMLGTRNDWVEIIERTEKLKKFGNIDDKKEGEYFKRWIDRLLIVFKDF